MENLEGIGRRLFKNTLDERPILIDSQLELPDYFNVDFLDGFTLPKTDRTISVILPTYNRSPFSPGDGEKFRCNPLYCSSVSILYQRGGIETQIIIVDDSSSDHTKKVVKEIRRLGMKLGVDVVYLRNREREGAIKSREKGVEIAEGDLCYLMDDDCIISPYALFGGIYTKDLMEAEGPILLPVYVRSTVPRKILEYSEIGKIDMEEGIITSNFDAFPLEYALHPEFIDYKFKILTPIKIGNLCCNYIVGTDVLRDIGFPVEFEWKNGHGEETEIGFRFREMGIQSYFLPDVKFHALHLKFGDIRKPGNIPKDWVSEILDLPFSLILEESSKRRFDTGCRTELEEWFYSKIRSFFQILSKRSPDAGLRWAIRTYKEFVVSYHGNNLWPEEWEISEKGKRAKIWRSAIYDGTLDEKNAYPFNYIERSISNLVENEALEPL
jgi:glycosyltransferase involved in cell wall biosynthesis